MKINDKKTVNAWCMYDWANSVYNLVITSTIFPIYYNNVTQGKDGSDLVRFFGFEIENSVLYAYALSVSYLLIVLCSPLLSGIADYGGKKKTFMKGFTFLGAFACIGLFFFTGDNIEWGIICALLASVGYAGSLVFYNAFLPEIVSKDRYDVVSAKGFSLGYIGSVLLLLVNLAMIKMPELFGLEKGAMPARISFLMVGIWWIGFSQISFYFLPNNVYHQRPDYRQMVKKGFGELRKVFSSLQHLPKIRQYLLSFFFYNMGVQTTMLLAATFGSKELNLPSGSLIATILLLQLVGVVGSYLFAWVSKKTGNKTALMIMIVIWIFICGGAYLTHTANQFYILAFFVGMVMGGIQSLSRATYSKLIPESTIDHASYFSFFDVTEKLAIVIGTFSYGFIEQWTGSMRYSALSLGIFFIVGLFLLNRLKSTKATWQLDMSEEEKQLAA